jgi:hypothetical protein
MTPTCATCGGADGFAPWIELQWSPTHFTNHPTDEDLSVGTPVARNGARVEGNRMNMIQGAMLVRSAPTGRESLVGAHSPDCAALHPGLFSTRPCGTRGWIWLPGEGR